MKLTGTTLALVSSTLATVSQAQILVPTGPVRGPNTLVFKEIGGVPNNECLTFTNNVCILPLLSTSHLSLQPQPQN